MRRKGHYFRNALISYYFFFLYLGLWYLAGWKVSENLKHYLDFSFVFSASLPAWRNLFWASGIFCSGRYQPGCTGIFSPAEDTNQPVTISKKWKNPISALLRKRTWVQALPWFSTCYLGLPASGTDLKSWKGLYWGPSPIQKVPHKGWELFIFGNGNTHTNNHVKFRNRPKREKKTTTNILPQQTE